MAAPRNNREEPVAHRSIDRDDLEQTARILGAMGTRGPGTYHTLNMLKQSWFDVGPASQTLD